MKLYYLRLPSPEVAIVRVRQRVAMGGHHIPEETIKRRFYSGWNNFQRVYEELADESAVWGNGEIPDNPGERAALHRAAQKARRLAIALTGAVLTIQDDQVVYETEP